MIQETKTSIIYVGDGVQTSFPFPYRYRDGRDVVGYVEKDGRWERITGNYEYHDGEKRYDYPTTGAPLAKGARLKLARETPRSQEQDFADDRIESAFDKVTMILQEMGAGVGVGDFGGLIPKGRPFAFLRYSEDATRLEVIDAPDWETHERVVLAAREEVMQDANEVRRLKERVSELHKTWREKQTQAEQELDRHVELGRTALDERARRKLGEIADAAQARVGEIQSAADGAKSALADAQEAAERVRAQGEQVRLEMANTARDAVGQIAMKGEEVGRRLEDAKRETAGLEASVKAAQEAAEQVAADSGAAQEAAAKAVDAMGRAKTAEISAQTAAAAAAGEVTAAESAAAKAQQAEDAAGENAERASTSAKAAKESEAKAQEYMRLAKGYSGVDLSDYMTKAEAEAKHAEILKKAGEVDKASREEVIALFDGVIIGGGSTGGEPTVPKGKTATNGDIENLFTANSTRGE